MTGGDHALSFLRRRQSVRAFLPKPVERAKVARLLEAATLAPSNHNCQPWHWVVVETPEAKAKLAERMGDAWRADLLRSGMKADVAEKLVQQSIARFSEAPVLLVPCLDLSRLPAVPDFLREEERMMGMQSVAMSAFALQLAAAQEGLGSCWYCAALYCPDVVVEALGLPEHLRPQATIVVGYPARSSKPRGRDPWQTVTTFR